MVKSDIYATLLRILNQDRFTLDVKKKKGSLTYVLAFTDVI